MHPSLYPLLPLSLVPCPCSLALLVSCPMLYLPPHSPCFPCPSLLRQLKTAQRVHEATKAAQGLFGLPRGVRGQKSEGEGNIGQGSKGKGSKVQGTREQGQGEQGTKGRRVHLIVLQITSWPQPQAGLECLGQPWEPWASLRSLGPA